MLHYRGVIKLSIVLALIFFPLSHPVLASSAVQIADDYRADPAAALGKYGWETMEFTGSVADCSLAYYDCATIWTIHMAIDGVDVIGYSIKQVNSGAVGTMRGTCSGIRRNGEKVTIVLDSAVFIK